jgi:catechol 2,3-dioxygenase-like lactoylglutathione lyase family enzyme
MTWNGQSASIATGLATQGIVGAEFEYGAMAFFELEGGLRLALFPRASLARDAGLVQESSGMTDFSIGHNVATRAEVDALLAPAAQAGAEIVKPAQETFWGGYAGCFLGPDRHLWEVAWNPDRPLPE